MKYAKERIWHIEYSNGFLIEAIRVHKPTRLARSWAQETNHDGSLFGTPTIREVTKRLKEEEGQV